MLFSSVSHAQSTSGLPARLATDVYQTKSPVSATVRRGQPVRARPDRTFPAGCRLTVRCAWSSHVGRALAACHPSLFRTVGEGRTSAEPSRAFGRAARTAKAVDCFASLCGPRTRPRTGRAGRCWSVPWAKSGTKKPYNNIIIT